MSERRRMELYGVVRREGSERDFWTRIGTALLPFPRFICCRIGP